MTFKHNANKELLERIHQTQSMLIYDLPFFTNDHYFTYKDNQGRTISKAVISQAPEPEDVLFVNYGQSTAEKIKVYSMTFAVTLVVLCVSFFLILGLTKLQMMYEDKQEAE